jgi:ABC-type uncharacterized transport system YnjBCD permease subunit
MVDSEVDNLIHAGVILGVYLFIAILVYFLLSGPVNAVFDGLNAGAQGVPSVKPYMDLYLPSIRDAVQIAFALGIAFPVTWFVFWVFSREPDMSFIRVG